MNAFRPSDVCKALLAALDAADGRRKSRKRDQTPDAIGLALKRDILEHVVQENPDPAAFEAWLLNYSQVRHASGAVAAMARAVLDEWRLAHTMGDFKVWLDRGAPSDDADGAAQFQGGRETRG
ncbi:MAG: hypothetical protein ACM3SP_13200 [Chloroflexota bacterium]